MRALASAVAGLAVAATLASGDVSSSRRRPISLSSRSPSKAMRIGADSLSASRALAEGTNSSGLAAPPPWHVSAECEVEAYYGELVDIFLNETTSAERIESHLHELISNMTELPYTSNVTDTWDALIDVDAFQGDVSSGQVMLLYSQKPRAASLAGVSDGGWNRQKLVPASYGVGSQGPGKVDLHNLRPTDYWVNNARGNRYFDWCQSGCDMPSTAASAPNTARDNERFMPPAAVRGDIARAVFYMATRYDGSDVGTLNIRLSDCPSADSDLFGKLSTLLEWHSGDPPDELERRRNDRVCSGYQHNRNPFVDFPHLVDRIFCGYQDPDATCTAQLKPPSCGGECKDLGGLVYAETKKPAPCYDLVAGEYCEYSLLVRERCRASCRMCSTPICKDSVPSGLIWDDTGKEAPCADVKEFCDITFVLDACPKTCGACADTLALPVPQIDPSDPPPPTTSVPLPAPNRDNTGTVVIVLAGLAGIMIVTAGVAFIGVIRRRQAVLARERESVVGSDDRRRSVVLTINPHFAQ